jgi:hypothetical protein
MRAACPTNFILLGLITLVISGEEYRLWSFSLLTFTQLRIIFSLLCSKILFGTLLSNILSPCSSITVREQVVYSHSRRSEKAKLQLYEAE